MLQCKIRIEKSQDIESITSVHDRAFKSNAEGGLVNLIRRSDFFIPELSIVAEKSGVIVGHVMFSKISLFAKGRDHNALSLAPVGVVPELQGQGIGQSLILEGIAKAKALGFSSILVLGNPVYYGRFGFRHDLTSKIQCKYSCKEFQALELKPNSLSVLEVASAIYPDAFAAVD